MTSRGAADAERQAALARANDLKYIRGLVARMSKATRKTSDILRAVRDGFRDAGLLHDAADITRIIVARGAPNGAQCACGKPLTPPDLYCSKACYRDAEAAADVQSRGDKQ